MTLLVHTHLGCCDHAHHQTWSWPADPSSPAAKARAQWLSRQWQSFAVLCLADALPVMCAQVLQDGRRATTSVVQYCSRCGHCQLCRGAAPVSWRF